ncbi:phage tail terminator protein [Volucribacter amazonae]|uniref:Phage tail protein n=1 Tax=Volucribacter amazonae TaxID=256731 RepID=A0A9X4PBJ5_9PAST|nr:phage tail terminator protein [Volucribacter amazonae]MDG6894526.1 phage tail protein [Volucribacter amazonae]
MLIHQKIREKVTALLTGNIPLINHIYPCRPLFIDIDQEKAVIAVFLSDIEAQEISLCSHQWNAALNIAIYLKTAEGEAELDRIAEQVKQCLQQAVKTEAIFDVVNEISLTEYLYEQDQTNRTWFVANIRYQINYED